MCIKSYLFFVLGILVFSKQALFAQINTGKALSGPVSVCGAGKFAINLSNPDKLVQYKAYVPGKVNAIDSTLGRPNENFLLSQLTLSGLDLINGINVITVTGKYSNLAYRVPNNTILVDGYINERYWNLANFNHTVISDVSSNALSPSPSNAVNFGLLWDDDYLYVGVKVIDPTPSTAQSRVAPNDYNVSDNVEIYINPLNHFGNYAQGGAFPQNLVKQIRSGYLSPSGTQATGAFSIFPDLRDASGIRSASQTFTGIAFKGIRTDLTFPGSWFSGVGYMVEFAIPWSNFYASITTPGAGMNFGFEVTVNDNQLINGQRNEQTVWGNDPENNRWGSTTKFGSITLVDPINLPASNPNSGLNEVFINVITVNNVIMPAPGATSLTGDCASGLTYTAALANTGSNSYWQTSPLGQSTTNLAASASAATPLVLASPVTTTTLYLNSYYAASQCWSLPQVIEVKPKIGTGANTVNLSKQEFCQYGIITSTQNIVTAATLAYWQNTSANGTNMTNLSSIPLTVTGNGNYGVRLVNTLTGCWSDETPFLPVTLLRPASPAMPTIGSPISCDLTTITYFNPTTLVGEVWYWQTSMAGTSTVSSALSTTLTGSILNPRTVPRVLPLIVSVSGTYYVRSLKNNGCWSDSTSSPFYNVTILGYPQTPVYDGVTTGCDSVLIPVTVTSGVATYWQQVATGQVSSSDRLIGSNTFVSTTSGTYYLRSLIEAGTVKCWSPPAGPLSVTVASVPVSENNVFSVPGCGAITLTAINLSPGIKGYWSNLPLSTDKSLEGIIIATTSGTYYLRLQNDNVDCWSLNVGKVLSINTYGLDDLPAAQVTYNYGDQASPIEIVSTVPGVQIRWYESISSNTVLEAVPVVNTAEAGTKTYYFTQYKEYCESNKVPFNIIINQFLVKLFPKEGFTPNGDNTNDNWSIENIDKFPGNKVTITDKWGNEVFAASGYNNTTVAFDGKRNGTDLPAGTYYYVVDIGDGSKVQSGKLLIIR